MNVSQGKVDKIEDVLLEVEKSRKAPKFIVLNLKDFETLSRYSYRSKTPFITESEGKSWYRGIPILRTYDLKEGEIEVITHKTLEI